MSSKKLNPFKDFQSDQIQRSSCKIFTAHYACRNATLNLTPVTGTNNGFIFQIINSLIESWGVRLTWFDCNTFLQLGFLQEVESGKSRNLSFINCQSWKVMGHWSTVISLKCALITLATSNLIVMSGMHFGGHQNLCLLNFNQE